ncbi:MAG TPA: hypothetical protein VG759_27020 [Candidatus Angelobacter sp.]|jgi:hypothetical protein|nr:hypothetical protein [Candidatus Angelobacter sp.]
MSHDVTIHNIERHKTTGGIAFVLKCCGEHEHSVHIQQPGKFSRDELSRMIEDHKIRVAKQHESHLRAEEFVRALASGPVEACGECG